jgi:hypothetical protein
LGEDPPRSWCAAALHEQKDPGLLETIQVFRNTVVYMYTQKTWTGKHTFPNDAKVMPIVIESNMTILDIIQFLDSSLVEW